MYRSLYTYYNISTEPVVADRGLYNYYNITSDQPVPVIDSLSVARSSEGASVTITGSGFGYSAANDPSNANRALRAYNGSVYLGSDVCTTTAWSWTSITFTVPTGAESGGVFVRLSAPAVIDSNVIGLEIFAPTTGHDTGMEFFLCSRANPNTVLCQLDGAYNKSFQTLLSMPGSGQFTISADDPKYPLVLAQTYVLCRVDGVDVFKWIIEGIQPNVLSESRDVICNGRGVLATLNQMVVYPAGFPHQTTNTRSFENYNALYILKTLIEEGQARGVLTGLTLDFTATHDSLGNEITEETSITFSTGTPMSEVINKLSDGLGLIDVEMTPDMTLKVYKSQPERLAEEPSAIYRPGQAIIGMDYQDDTSKLINVVLVEGQDGTIVESSHPTLPATWGRREGYLSAGNIPSTWSYLARYGENFVKKLGTRDVSVQGRVVAFEDSSGNIIKPYETFKLGDWVGWYLPRQVSDTRTFDWTSIDWTEINFGGDSGTDYLIKPIYRVKGITVEESDTLIYTLDLNTIKAEREIRTAQQVERLSGFTQNDSLTSGNTSTVPTVNATVTGLRAFGETSMVGTIDIKAGDGIEVTQDGTNKDIIVENTGVLSICKSGETGITGDVVFEQGSNVTIEQDGNTITIAAASGGGGSSLPLDTPPGSANAKDDEFSSSSLDAKWSWLNQGGASYSLPGNGGISIIKPSEAINLRSIVQSRPSGDFTVTAKIACVTAYTETYGGIVLVNSSTGNHFTIGFRNNEMGQTAYTDFAGSGAHDYSVYGVAYPTIWVKVVVVGTNMDIYYSNNGIAWPQSAQKSVSVPTSFDKVGLGVQCGIANRPITLLCDYFRVTE